MKTGLTVKASDRPPHNGFAAQEVEANEFQCTGQMRFDLTRSTDVGLGQLEMRVAVKWLALFHGTFWGARADKAVLEGGLGFPFRVAIVDRHLSRSLQLPAEPQGKRVCDAIRGRRISAGGLRSQGCFWRLDAREDEFARMSPMGWQARLRAAARAVDARLKAPLLLSHTLDAGKWRGRSSSIRQPKLSNAGRYTHRAAPVLL